jgi:hypothetical protein
LLNAPKNPMGCYELARFPSRDAMIDELMTIYATRPTLNLPPVQDAPGVFQQGGNQFAAANALAQ